jgi:hypothetical protein
MRMQRRQRHHRSVQPGRRRRSAFTLVMLGLALGIASCGGGSPGGVATAGPSTTSTASRSSSRGTPYEDALRYSKCMRAHGVANFPDPDAQGDIRMSSSGSGVDARTPQYQAAAKNCQKLEPATGQSTSPPGAQLLPEWLKYAACMRAHGIANYPDPKPIGNYGVTVQIPKSLHIDQSSPQFLAADKACQALLKGNGPGGSSG